MTKYGNLKSIVLLHRLVQRKTNFSQRIYCDIPKRRASSRISIRTSPDVLSPRAFATFSANSFSSALTLIFSCGGRSLELGILLISQK